MVERKAKKVIIYDGKIHVAQLFVIDMFSYIIYDTTLRTLLAER